MAKGIIYCMTTIENGILAEDVICNSPSTAGWVVLGNANNGWLTWKILFFTHKSGIK